MPGKILVDVGIKIDESQIRSAFSSAFNSLGKLGDNMDISTDAKKQIKELEAAVEELQKKYNGMSKAKLNTSSFEKEKAAIIEQVNAIEQRTSILEDSMRSLISTMSGADSSGFSNWIKEVRTSMDDLKSSTSDTVDAISKISSGLGKKTNFHIADSISSQVTKLREALEIFEKIEGQDFSFKGSYDRGDVYDGLEEAESAIKEYVRVRKQLNKTEKSDPLFADLQKNLAEAAYKIQNLFEQLRTTFGDSVLDENVLKKNSGGYFTVLEYFEKVESEAKSRAQSINSILNEIGDVGKTNKPNTIAIDFDVQQSTNGLTSKLKRAINATQKYADANPIEVEINLISKWEKQTKKYSDAFEKMQKNISQIEDDETRGQFQNVLDEIGKGWGKELLINLKSSLGETQAEIESVLNKVKTSLKEAKFTINPEIEFGEETVTKAQEELNKVAGFNVSNLEKYVSTIKEIVSQFKQLSENGFKLGFDNFPEVSGNIEKITSSLRELLDIYKQLNIADTGAGALKLAEKLKALGNDTINIGEFKKIFGSANIEQLQFADKMKPKTSESDSYYLDWANNIIKATDRAGLAIDEFKNKENSVFESIKNIELGGDQFEKLVNNSTTLKNSLNSLRTSLDLKTIINPINDLKDVLLEFSDVYQRVNGVLSSSNLEKEFLKIKEAAEKLNGIKLNTKDGKTKANDLLAMYKSYISAGGTRPIKDIGAANNISKYMTKNLGETESAENASKEAGALKEVQSAADAAASAKEKFAIANKELFQSIISSVSGIDNEGKAFENINKLFNSISKDKDGLGTQKLLESLKSIQKIMSTPVDADSFIKSLENLANTGDSLKDLATVLRSTKKQIDNATKVTGIDNGAPSLNYNQTRLNNNLKEIQESGKTSLSQWGKVIGTTVRENSDGLIEMIGLIRTANNELKEITITSPDGNLWNVEKSEANTTRILNQAQKLEKIRLAWERMNKVPDNTTDQIMFDKDNTDAETWEEMISLAKAYSDEIGNLQRVSRQVRQDRDGNLLESFSFIGDRGHITMGREGDIVASSQELAGLQRIQQEFNNLSKDAARYYELREKQVSGTATSHEVAELERLDAKYNELIADVERYNSEFGENNIANSSMERYLQTISKNYDDYIAKFQEKTQGKLDSAMLTRGNQRNDYTAEFRAEIRETESLINELNEIRSKYKPGDIWNTDDLQRVNSIFQEINGTIKGLGDNSNILAKTEDVEKLIGKLSKDLNDNSMSLDLSGRYQNLIDYLMKVRTSGDDVTNTLSQIDKVTLGRLQGQFQSLHSEMERTGQTGKGFFKQFTSAITSKSAQFLAQYFSFQDFIRYGRELSKTVTEINSAQTELRKVSDASQARIQENFQKSAETAKELGATITDVISSTSDWARLGYSVDQSEELARVTTLYQNVGDNMTQESASESLISTLKGFQMDASEGEEIVDKFNEVANNYAIDTAGIGEALQRSASAFNASHTSLDKSIALITATNTVMQDPEKVGTLWNTVSARIRGASTELETLGEDTDDYVTTTSKLRDLVKGYTGFDIQSDADTYKDLYDIVLGIGQEWKNLTDIQRAGLAEALGGKRNARGLLAIFDNLDELQGAYQTAQTSAGSAAKEQEHYAESVQYSIDRAKASLQELAYDFLSSDTLKSLIDFGNRLLEIVDGIVSRLGTLGSTGLLGGIASVVKGFATNKGIFADLIQWLGNKKGQDVATGRTLSTVLNMLGVGKDAGKKAGEELAEQVAEGAGRKVSSTLVDEFGRPLEYAMKRAGTEAAGEVAGDAIGNAAAKKGAKTFVGKFLGFMKANPALAVGGGIILGTAIAKGAYDKYKKDQIENASTATNDFENTKANVESYKSQYKQLYEQLHSADTSEAQRIEIRKQLLALQQQIVSEYGKEAESINLVTGNLEQQLGILDQITAKKAYDLLEDNATKRAYKDAAKEMTKDRTIDFGTIDADFEEGQLSAEIKKVVDNIDGLELAEDGTGLYNIRFTGNVDEADSALAIFSQHIIELKRQFEDDDIATGFLDGISDSIKTAQSNIDEIYKNYQDNYLSGLEQNFLKQTYGTENNDLLLKYAEARNKMQEAALSEDSMGFSKAQAQASDLYNQLQNINGLDFDTSIKPLVDQIDDGIDKASELKENLKDLTDDNGVNMTNPFREDRAEIVQLMNDLKKERLDESDFAVLTADMDELGSTSPKIKKLGEALNFSFDDADKYASQMSMLCSILKDLGVIITVVDDNVADVGQSFDTFRASVINDIANIDTLNAALAESFSGKGLTYSIDESGELVGSIAEIKKAYGDLMKADGFDQSQLFEKTANGIHLNQQALRALQSQQEANNKSRFIERENELLEEQANLQMRLASYQDAGLDTPDSKWADNIDGLKSALELNKENLENVRELSAAYDGATSAYQKWVNAQSMGEEGDMYNAIRDTAISRGKELYDQNLVGTNEFRSIAQLFSNEDLTTAPIEKIVSAYEDGAKAVSQYFTEDNTGLVKFAEKVKSMGDEVGHVSGENGEYSFFGMNFAKIADKLGVSEDIINSIFRRFNDYGFNIRFFDEEQVQQLNEIKNRADDAQAALRKMDDVTADIGGKKVKLSDAIDFDIAELDKEGLTSKLSELTEFRDQLIKVNADPTQIQLLDTLIQQLQADIDVTNGATVSPNVNFTDLVKVGEKIAELQEKLKLFNEFKLKNPELKIEEDPQLMADLQYVASLGKEQLKLNYGIEVDDPSNVQEVADAIMNMPDEKTTTVDAKTNYKPGNIEKPTEDQIDATAQTDYEPGNIEKPTEDQIDATAQTDYEVGDIEKPSKEALKVKAEVEYVPKRDVYKNRLAANKKVEQKVNTKEEHETTTITHEKTDKSTIITADDQATPTINAVQTAINNMTGTKVVITADGGAAEKEIHRIDGMDIKQKNFIIDANARNATSKIAYVNSLSLPSKSVTVTANTFVASKNLQGVINKLNLIKDKTITVKTNYVSSGGGGGGNAANGTAHALGTTGKAQHTPSYYTPARYNGSVGHSMLHHYRQHAYAGGQWGLEQDEPDALVNELGPEIVVRDGSYYILNSGYPTLANSSKSGLPGGLKKGDIIFNHLQTEEILKHGYVTGSHAKMIGGRAHADGTVTRGGSAFGGGGGRGSLNLGGGGQTQKREKKPKSTPTKPSRSTGGNNNNNNNNNKKDKPVDKSSVKISLKTEGTVEWLDWIEILLERIETQLDIVQTKADSTFRTFGHRANYAKSAANTIQKEITAQTKAEKKYATQADTMAFRYYRKETDKNGKTITKDKKTGKQLTGWFQGITNKEAEAALKLFSASEQKSLKTKGKINNTKVLNALKKAIQEGRIDIDRLAYNGDGADAKATESIKEKIELYRDWYDKSQECKKSVAELNEQLKEQRKALFELEQTHYEGILENYEGKVSAGEEWISKREAQGYNIGTGAYERLIAQNATNRAKLVKERTALQTQLNAMVKNGTVEKDSEEWHEMNNAIQAVKQSILECDTQTAEWNKEIRQLGYDRFDAIQEKIADIAAEAEFMNTVLKENDLFNDDGSRNEYGNATLGLTAISYDAYINQAEEYRSAVADINKEINKEVTDKTTGKKTKPNLYNQELLDRRKELIEAQRTSIENAYKERDAMKSLVEEGIKKQLEAMKKVIDEYTKLLDTQKDAYTYASDISDKAEEINNLRKQVVSWAGDTSEEGAARRQRVEKQLRDAEKALAEKQEDRRISQTKEMLSELYDSYEKTLNSRLDDVDALVTELIAEVNIGQNGIISTIKEAAGAIGYSFTDAMNVILTKNGTSNMVGIMQKDKAEPNYGNATNKNRVADATTNTSSTESIVSKATNQAVAEDERGTTGVSNAISDVSTKKSGWYTDKKGRTYYYMNGKKLTMTQKIEGQKYFFDKNGVMQVGWTYFKKDKKTRFFRRSDGVMMTGTHTIDKIKYTFDKNGWLKLNTTAAKNRQATAKKNHKYRRGTSNVPYDEYAWTQEAGGEMILRKSDGAMLTPLGKGDMVFTNQMSKNLWNMAKDPLKALAGQVTSHASTSVNNTSVGDITNNFSFNLPNVKDSDEFIRELQHNKKFENIIKSMTLGTLSGKGSLNKFRTHI